MKVRELIEELQNFDLDLEVMIDITEEGEKIFHFGGVVEVEEVTIDDDEKIVVLFSPDTVIRFDRLNEN